MWKYLRKTTGSIINNYINNDITWINDKDGESVGGKTVYIGIYLQYKLKIKSSGNWQHLKQTAVYVSQFDTLRMNDISEMNSLSVIYGHLRGWKMF